jgi:signal peptidase II
MKRIILFLATIVVLIVVDQWSKIYVATNFYLGESIPVIDGIFNLTYVQNTGAAFGFGGQYPDWIRYAAFRALPVIACVWLFVLLFKSYREKPLISSAYTLILAGAIGNLIDRFRLDYVVDMFHFYFRGSHFSVFNVADSAITVAAGLLIIDYFVERKNEKLTNASKL